MSNPRQLRNAIFIFLFLKAGRFEMKNRIYIFFISFFKDCLNLNNLLALLNISSPYLSDIAYVFALNGPKTKESMILHNNDMSSGLFLKFMYSCNGTNIENPDLSFPWQIWWPIVKILTGWVDCLWVDLPSSPRNLITMTAHTPKHCPDWLIFFRVSRT